MKELTMAELREYAKENKAKYPVGSRLVIIEMADDRLVNPHIKTPPLPAGLRGTVQLVDDMGQVHCLFDNGSSGLALNEADKFRPLAQHELEEEAALKTVQTICESGMSDCFYDHLYDEVCNQFNTDDDTPCHKYSALVRKYLTEKDPAVKDIIDDVAMSFTGWKLSTLLANTLEAAIDTKHISEVVEGDCIIHDGEVYTATSDAYMTDTDNGKEWNVEVEDGTEDYLYASYFEHGMVTVLVGEEAGDSE